MRKSVESKFKLSGEFSLLSGWDSSDQGVYADLSPNLTPGSGVSEVLGQDLNLLKLQVDFMYTPGLVQQSINLGTASATITSNPFASKQRVRWAIVAMDRVVAANIGSNFMKAMYVKWTPRGRFPQDFQSGDNRQSYIEGMHIIDKGEFTPKYENISCTPDYHSVSGVRTLSIPQQTTVSISCDIGRKLRLTAANPKNFQRWVYALYISQKDGFSVTGSYNDFTDPKSIYYRYNFVYQDA